MKELIRVEIAVVISDDGHITVCGPHDFNKTDYDDAMNAAIGWHMEAGHLVADRYWLEADFDKPVIHRKRPLVTQITEEPNP